MSRRVSRVPSHLANQVQNLRMNHQVSQVRNPHQKQMDGKPLLVPVNTTDLLMRVKRWRVRPLAVEGVVYGSFSWLLWYPSGVDKGMFIYMTEYTSGSRLLDPENQR